MTTGAIECKWKMTNRSGSRCLGKASGVGPGCYITQVEDFRPQRLILQSRINQQRIPASGQVGKHVLSGADGQLRRADNNRRRLVLPMPAKSWRIASLAPPPFPLTAFVILPRLCNTRAGRLLLRVINCWRPRGAGTFACRVETLLDPCLGVPAKRWHECRRGRLRVYATTFRCASEK
jgi:hypothetical protein